MAYKAKAEIYKQPDGKFAFENGQQIIICNDPDDVGANLEQILWPLLIKPLQEGKPITITIADGTDEL